MKVTKLNIKQVQWAIRACEEKRGLEFIVNCFNACIERGEMELVFNLPTNAYKRYAHLLADLVRIEGQMMEAVQEEATAINEALEVVQAPACKLGIVKRTLIGLLIAGVTSTAAHADTIKLNCLNRADRDDGLAINMTMQQVGSKAETVEVNLATNNIHPSLTYFYGGNHKYEKENNMGFFFTTRQKEQTDVKNSDDIAISFHMNEQGKVTPFGKNIDAVAARSKTDSNGNLIPGKTYDCEFSEE